MDQLQECNCCEEAQVYITHGVIGINNTNCKFIRIFCSECKRNLTMLSINGINEKVRNKWNEMIKNNIHYFDETLKEAVKTHRKLNRKDIV